MLYLVVVQSDTVALFNSSLLKNKGSVRVPQCQKIAQRGREICGG